MLDAGCLRVTFLAQFFLRLDWSTSLGALMKQLNSKITPPVGVKIRDVTVDKVGFADDVTILLVGIRRGARLYHSARCSKIVWQRCSICLSSAKIVCATH